jgi:hypothetical protein
VGGDINFTGNLYKSASLFQTGVGWSNNGSNIFSNSNIAIGTSTANIKLDVCGSLGCWAGSTWDHLYLSHDGATGYIRGGGCDGGLAIQVGATSSGVYGGQTYTECIRCLSSGNVGIGVSPSYKLHVSGDIYATGDITAFSDVKAKENLVEIPNALDKVKQLTGYTYDMPAAERKKRYTGLIAQDVQKVLPEAVNESGDGGLGIAYGNLAGILVQAIKEMEDKYENKIMDLEKQLGERDKQLSDIWSKLNSL